MTELERAIEVYEADGYKVTLIEEARDLPAYTGRVSVEIINTKEEVDDGFFGCSWLHIAIFPECEPKNVYISESKHDGVELPRDSTPTIKFCHKHGHPSFNMWDHHIGFGQCASIYKNKPHD